MESIDLTTRPFDPANYLKTPEDMAAYLGVVAESGDARRFVRAMGDIIRAHNMSELSRQSGISREGIRKAFAADGNPSLDTLVSITSALGLSMQFTAMPGAESLPGRYLRVPPASGATKGGDELAAGTSRSPSRGASVQGGGKKTPRHSQTPPAKVSRRPASRKA